MRKIYVSICAIIGTAVTMANAAYNVKVILTRGDESKLLSVEPEIQFYPRGDQQGSFFIDTRNQYQYMEGVGASFTDSAAWLMRYKLDAGARSNLIKDLFTERGANLNYIRLPLSSSDLAVSDFTNDDMPYPQTDPNLDHFNLNSEHDYAVPIMQEMKSVNPHFKVVGTAWSAPGWMKSGNQA